MNTWLAIGLVAAGSFGLRFAPMLFAERLQWSDTVDRALRHAGTAALVYVIVGGVLGAGRGDWSHAVAAVAGIALGLALTVRGRRPLTVVAAGLGVAWLIAWSLPALL